MIPTADYACIQIGDLVAPIEAICHERALVKPPHRFGPLIGVRFTGDFYDWVWHLWPGQIITATVFVGKKYRSTFTACVEAVSDRELVLSSIMLENAA